MDITRLRQSLGLTQVRLARVTGVHPMTVSKWERGLLRPNAHQRELLEAFAAGRGEAAQTATRELAGLLNRVFIEATEIGGMQLSASNQLKGRIVELEEGPVSARIVIEIAPRVRITSVITTASSRRLKLKVGKAAVAIIKATEVIVGVR